MKDLTVGSLVLDVPEESGLLLGDVLFADLSSELLEVPAFLLDFGGILRLLKGFRIGTDGGMGLLVKSFHLQTTQILNQGQ